MREQEFKTEFNKTMGKILTLLEVSNNHALKREVKSVLFDFSDSIRDRVITEKELNNDNKKQPNNL